MKYTAEEVREAAATNEHPIPLRVRDMLTAYADSLERAQGGVTDGVVDVAHDTIFGHPSFDIGENGFLGKPAVRAALLAVWPTTTNPSETGSKLVDAELYKSACDSAEEWKARALKADRITEQLGDALNDMTGPTFMGEPVLSKPVAHGDASHGRCKACERATRAVCDGLDGNGLGCTNAPPINLAAVREVIAHLRSFRSNTPPTWAHLDDAADKLETALPESKP